MKNLLIFVVALLLGLAPVATCPQEQIPVVLSDHPETLKGIKKIYLSSAGCVHDEARKANLPNEKIRDIVELRLLEAGIKLAALKESLHDAIDSKKGDIADLTLRLTVLPLDGGYVWSLQTSVNMDALVRIGGKSKRVVSATIWNNTNLGFLGNQRIDAFPNIIKEHLDTFVLDYLKANPK